MKKHFLLYHLVVFSHLTYEKCFPDADINADTYVQNYTILISEPKIVLSPIEIVDDMIPETDEEFTLSLMKGEDTADLNVFPSTSVVRMTIRDDDGKFHVNISFRVAWNFFMLSFLPYP